MPTRKAKQAKSREDRMGFKTKEDLWVLNGSHEENGWLVLGISQGQKRKEVVLDISEEKARELLICLDQYCQENFQDAPDLATS